MNRPDTSGLEQSVIDYINWQDGCLNGSSELILALNTASRVFADDLNMICDGDSVAWLAEGDADVPKSKLTLLSGDSKDKTFDRIMVLFDKFDKIKALSQHFTGTNIQQAKAVRLTLKPGENIFEKVITDIKKNGNSKV